MTRNALDSVDLLDFTESDWTSTVDAIRKLGDVYEKKRRVEELLRGCEDADESDFAPAAWSELQRNYAVLQDVIGTLEDVVLEDDGAVGGRAGGCGEEVIGETLDELFGGLNLAAGGPGARPSATLTETEATTTRPTGTTKIVELKPGRQYRKAVRKYNNNGDATVVRRERRAGPADALDATSADERGDEELELEPGYEPGYEQVSSDVDVAALEAARYAAGGGEGGKGGKGGKLRPGALEIPVSEDVLVRAAMTGGRGPGEASDSSGGSTHAVVGKNRGEWYGRVGADDRRVGAGAGEESSDSGSESGESMTSPAVVVESAWRKE